MPIFAPEGYLDITNATLRGSEIITTSNVGIMNANPTRALSVGSNLHVSAYSSNVVQVNGNVVAQGLKLGFIEVLPSYDLSAVSNVGNVTLTTIQFSNVTTAFVADSNIEVGTANLFVDTQTGRVGVGTDSPSKTLDVNGDATISGNLTVSGTTTVVNTENLSIKDPIIELGRDNVADPEVDLGLIMTRPSGEANVAMIYDESADSLEIGHTMDGAQNSTITMDTANALAVNIHGSLDVSSDLTVGATGVDSNVILHANKTYSSAGRTTTYTGLSSSNANEIGYLDMSVISASNNTFVKVFVKAGQSAQRSEMEYSFYIRPNSANFASIYDYKQIGSLSIVPVVYRTNATDLYTGASGGVVRFGYLASSAQNVTWRVEMYERSGNAKFVPTNTGSAVDGTGLVQVTPAPNMRIDSNVAIGGDDLFVDTTTGNVGIGTTNPTSNLHVVGTAAISSNLAVNTDDLFVDTQTGRVGVGTVNPTYTLDVNGLASSKTHRVFEFTGSDNYARHFWICSFLDAPEYHTNQLIKINYSVTYKRLTGTHSRNSLASGTVTLSDLWRYSTNGTIGDEQFVTLQDQKNEQYSGLGGLPKWYYVRFNNRGYLVLSVTTRGDSSSYYIKGNVEFLTRPTAESADYIWDGTVYKDSDIQQTEGFTLISDLYPTTGTSEVGWDETMTSESTAQNFIEATEGTVFKYGNVGIGATNPQAKLDTRGDAVFDTGKDDTTLTGLLNYSSTQSAIDVGVHQGASAGSITASTDINPPPGVAGDVIAKYVNSHTTEVYTTQFAASPLTISTGDVIYFGMWVYATLDVDIDFYKFGGSTQGTFFTATGNSKWTWYERTITSSSTTSSPEFRIDNNTPGRTYYFTGFTIRKNPSQTTGLPFTPRYSPTLGRGSVLSTQTLVAGEAAIKTLTGSTYIGGTPDDDWTYEAPCVHVNSLPRNLMHLRMPDNEGQTNSLKNFPYAIDGRIDDNGEQEFAMGSNPWGVSTMLWRNKGTSGGICGGWERVRFRCSYRRSYMSVVFVKRSYNSTDATARFYHGCSTSNTSNLDGTVNTNPYFHNLIYNLLPREVWCVSIGFVHHRGATTSNDTGTGGIYRLDTMEKLTSSSTEYKFKDEADYQEQRAFYYDNQTASRYLDFWNPGFYDMDTNVPELGFLKNFSYSVRTENLWVGQWQTKTWYGGIGGANTTTTIIVFDRSARGSNNGGEMCGELTIFCHRDGGNQHRAYAKFQVNYTHWYGSIWYGNHDRQHFNNNSGVSDITMSSDATAGTISVSIASTTNTTGQYFIKFDGPFYNP